MLVSLAVRYLTMSVPASAGELIHVIHQDDSVSKVLDQKIDMIGENAYLLH